MLACVPLVNTTEPGPIWQIGPVSLPLLNLRLICGTLGIDGCACNQSLTYLEIIPVTTAQQLERALTRPDGSAVEIERIEVEIVSGGRFRWNIWADGRRVFSDTASASQVAGMLKCTAVLLNAALGVPPGPCVPASEWN